MQGDWWRQHCKRQQRRERWDTQTWRKSTVGSAAISTMTSRSWWCFSTHISWAGLVRSEALTYHLKEPAFQCPQIPSHLSPCPRKLLLLDRKIRRAALLEFFDIQCNFNWRLILGRLEKKRRLEGDVIDIAYVFLGRSFYICCFVWYPLLSSLNLFYFCKSCDLEVKITWLVLVLSFSYEDQWSSLWMSRN